MVSFPELREEPEEGLSAGKEGQACVPAGSLVPALCRNINSPTIGFCSLFGKFGPSLQSRLRLSYLAHSFAHLL